MTEQEANELDVMVNAVARGIHGRLPSSVDLDDLVSVGWIGAIDARKRFDPDRGISLASFARGRISGQILDYLRDIDHLSRDHRRAVKAGLAANPDIIELDAPKPGEVIYQLSDLRSDKAFEQVVNSQSLTKLVGMANIKPRHAQILESYYWGGLKMAEVGRKFRINESRVSHIIKAAVHKLRIAAVGKRATKRIEIRLALMVPGTTTWEVTRILGVSKDTVRKIAAQIRNRPPCPCGNRVEHQGWCSFRYQRSEARQQVVQNWHKRRSHPVDLAA